MLKKVLAYTIPVLLCLAIGAIGSYIQTPALRSWYPTLEKSSLTPPAIVFPIAWTILYIMIGLSIGRLIVQGDMSIVRLWIFQLLINFLWSVGFFALRSPLLGLITILILDVLVFAYTLSAFSSDKVAGWLFVPYMLWLVFATYLTGYIFLNNRPSATLRAANVSNTTIIMDSNRYNMPALPYPSDALEPIISKESIDYHYGKDFCQEGHPLTDITLENVRVTGLLKPSALAPVAGEPLRVELRDVTMERREDALPGPWFITTDDVEFVLENTDIDLKG